MTVVYYVRHARPNLGNHDDLSRELSEEGLRGRAMAAEALSGVSIDAVLSSPYRRAVETVRPLAEARGLTIETVDDFRERKVGDAWIDDFHAFARRQWADFDYKLPGGESLRETRARNVAALERVLDRFGEKTVAIGGHGTALGAIWNFYDPRFDGAAFLEMKDRMPLIARFQFAGRECAGIEILYG